MFFAVQNLYPKNVKAVPTKERTDGLISGAPGIAGGGGAIPAKTL